MESLCIANDGEYICFLGHRLAVVSLFVGQETGNSLATHCHASLCPVCHVPAVRDLPCTPAVSNQKERQVTQFVSPQWSPRSRSVKSWLELRKTVGS